MLEEGVLLKMEVKTFNETKAKEALKKCPKIVRDYVELLQKHLKNKEELIALAINKLREITKEVENKT